MNHPSDSKVMSQIEEQLKEASSNVLSEINTHIANAPAPTPGTVPGKKNIKVFIVPGAQCMGKSWICSQLDSRKSKICSADYHMHKDGKVFDYRRLSECHSKCAMDVYNSIINGTHSIVDNTNMRAQDISIYKLICDIMGCELVIIPILPTLLLMSNELEQLLSVLVARSKNRQKETGQSLGLYPESVIRNTIENARKELAIFKFNTLSTDSKITQWFNSFPIPTRKQGLLIERSNTLLARTSNINELFYNYTSGQSGLSKEELLLMDIKRGYGEHHVTLVGPDDFLKIPTSITSTLVGNINEHPNLLGYTDPTPGKIETNTTCNGDTIVYMNLDWEWGRLIREKWGLEPKQFILTITE